MNNMKILQVNKFNYIRGGAEKYFIDLSKELEKAGHEVAVFSMKHPKNFKSKWEKYFVSRISFNEASLRDKLLAPFRILYSFEAKIKFKKLIKDFKPDIIHIHNIYHQISPSILSVAKKYKIPVVMHVHDYKLICPNYQLFVDNQICYRCRGGKYYKCLKHKCFKKSYLKSFLAAIEMYFHHRILNIYFKNIDLFIAPSNFMKETLVSFKVPEEKIKVIYNFTVINQVENQGGDYGLYFGRLSSEKGVDVLLKALALSKGDLKIKIVGSGPEEKQLKTLCDKLKLNNRVEFLGYKLGVELELIIKNAKVIFMPSIWAENMPFSLLESLSFSKVVIASKIGGMSELIEDNKSGFLFQNGDFKTLASKIDSLEHCDLRQIGQRARERVLDLNINKHLEEILKIYKQYVK